MVDPYNVLDWWTATGMTFENISNFVLSIEDNEGSAWSKWTICSYCYFHVQSTDFRQPNVFMQLKGGGGG